MLPHIYQGNSLTIVIEGKQHTINRDTHPNFAKIIDAIRANDWDSVPNLVDMTRVIADYASANGDIEVKDGDVFYQGRPFANAITDRLLTMLEEDFPVEPLCNFLSNLKDNPSKRAVDELYLFLENNSLPLTPDGHFLAYKKVRDDYKDIHSGTFDNSVGQICEMPRNEVNEDRDQTCSDGLHFCSLEYLPNFGSSTGNHVMIVKINPADVVSIPSDYNNAKGRTCRYEVIGEHEAENRDYTEAFDRIVVGDFEDDNDEDEFNDFEDFDLFDDDFDLENGNVREVYTDSNGRYRYSDDGRYASSDAYDAWQDYEADNEDYDYDDAPREVVRDTANPARFRFADNGYYASRDAWNEWNEYLDR